MVWNTRNHVACIDQCGVRCGYVVGMVKDDSTTANEYSCLASVPTNQAENGVVESVKAELGRVGRKVH
jgi:hypothetical protein